MRPSRPSTVRGFQSFLRARGLVFACAESCTGGLIARQMTALAGSSAVFWGGLVTYANEAKTTLLGVPLPLLEREGAVSGEVALAMVDGLVRASGVPLAVAVTGIAGPSGGTPEKPVGTVWFGLAARRTDREGRVAVRARFSGSRNEIQGRAARWAWRLAIDWWESGMELDSLRSLTDNEGNAVVETFLPPLFFPPTP